MRSQYFHRKLGGNGQETWDFRTYPWFLFHTTYLAFSPLRSGRAARNVALDIFDAMMDEPEQDFLFSLLVIRGLGAQDGLGLLPWPLVRKLRLRASPLGRRQCIIAELASFAAVTTCGFRLITLYVTT